MHVVPAASIGHSMHQHCRFGFKVQVVRLWTRQEDVQNVLPHPKTMERDFGGKYWLAVLDGRGTLECPRPAGCFRNINTTVLSKQLP